MSIGITGIVTNGVIVPNLPLPEGTQVAIYLNDDLEVLTELKEELAAWQQGSAEALALVESLVSEEQPDEKG